MVCTTRPTETNVQPNDAPQALWLPLRKQSQVRRYLGRVQSPRRRENRSPESGLQPPNPRPRTPVEGRMRNVADVPGMSDSSGAVRRGARRPAEVHHTDPRLMVLCLQSNRSVDDTRP